MKYLLDTSIWLWSVGPTHRISQKGRDLLADGKQELYLSAASAWEIGIKMALGKLQLPGPPARYVPRRMAEQNIQALPILHQHALGVYSLPAHHQDPFDRLLIAQANSEGMVILTADKVFRKYQVEIVLCGS
jgi:PIN domain nuclease of toxin-antitoxin system